MMKHNTLLTLPRSLRRATAWRSAAKDRGSLRRVLARGIASTSNAEVYRLLRQFNDGDRMPTMPDRSRDVFANSEVDLGSIEVVGFDYDYTLAEYTEALPNLMYCLARDFLVDTMQYPESFRYYEYDPTFAIRGLTYDFRTGLLMKLSNVQSIDVNSVFRGRQRLRKDEVLRLYNNTVHIPASYRDEYMRGLLDLFSLAEACLIADVTQLFVDRGVSFNPTSVAEDVRNSIEFVHRSGNMHNAVIADPETYLHRTPQLVNALEHWRQSGRSMFLLTNSHYRYIEAGLSYLVGPSWKEYFDAVVVSSRKPSFYAKRRPFRAIDLESGSLMWHNVDTLSPGNVYAMGSAEDLLDLMGWRGNKVLYIGDNLFADLQGPRSSHGWVTGAIIRELETHLKDQDGPRASELRRKLVVLNRLLRLLQHLPRTGLETPGAGVGRPVVTEAAAEGQAWAEPGSGAGVGLEPRKSDALQTIDVAPHFQELPDPFSIVATWLERTVELSGEPYDEKGELEEDKFSVEKDAFSGGYGGHTDAEEYKEKYSHGLDVNDATLDRIKNSLIRLRWCCRANTAKSNGGEKKMSQEAMGALLDGVEGLRDLVRHRKHASLNLQFGSIFTTDTAPTLFAASMVRYVDLYTSRVENFLAYPSNYRFYPTARLLAHQQDPE